MSFQQGHSVEPVCLETAAGAIRPSFTCLCSARSVCISTAQTLPDCLMLRGDWGVLGTCLPTRSHRRSWGSTIPCEQLGVTSQGDELVAPVVGCYCPVSCDGTAQRSQTPCECTALLPFCTALPSATKSQSIRLLLFIYLFIWGWTLIQLKTKNKICLDLPLLGEL